MAGKTGARGCEWACPCEVCGKGAIESSALNGAFERVEDDRVIVEEWLGSDGEDWTDGNFSVRPRLRRGETSEAVSKEEPI